MKKPKKKKFVVDINDSINDCLKSMDKEGYIPVRRIEKPIFKEGKNGPEVIGRSIVFEGRLDEKSEQ
ncbi:NETI motif-containing protein [Scopulibacillus cellulosilyticus]|uniref:NETI motif-containing protein n=1 Tax=Scopulibacillus cellulosilyticus TaxID=2665665 RepID=A0ABW2PXU0_9BACL